MTRLDVINDAYEALAQERSALPDEDYARRKELIDEARKEIAAPYDALCDEALQGLLPSSSQDEECLSEHWLIANLPDGWTYDCTFTPRPAFVIVAPDGSSFLLPLAFLK